MYSLRLDGVVSGVSQMSDYPLLYCSTLILACFSLVFRFAMLMIRLQLATIPDRLTYSTVRIESPTGRSLLLPRRELYDVRVQLMAEDDADNDEILTDIDKSDIRTGVYEGGFKTWECSLDLASLLLDRGPRKDIDELVRCDQVIEVSTA